MLLYLKISYYC